MNFWFRHIPVPDWSLQNAWTVSVLHNGRVFFRSEITLEIVFYQEGIHLFPIFRPYFTDLFRFWGVKHPSIAFSPIFLMKNSPKLCFIVWHMDKFRTFVAIQYARRGIYWIVLIGRLQALSSKSKSRKFDSTRRYGTIGVHV